MDDHHFNYFTKLKKKKKKTLAANKQGKATNKIINPPTDQPNKGIWKNNF
jgi:hypothetical protein